MKKWKATAAVTLTVGLSLMFLRACTAISIAPECPAEMRVGETRDVFANEMNPGSIARYQWEAFPPERGVFADPLAPDTTFQALVQGEIVLRLTASDGLYQVISECRTRVQGFVEVAVQLTYEPEETLVREPVTLTCESVGATDAVERTIVQTEGRLVDLVEIDEGVVRFETERAGELVFRCVGQNAAGDQSEPTFVTINVIINDNFNLNTNRNDNDEEDTNDNDEDDEIDNETTNTNDN